ncbi:MAG: hypothetical protein ABIU10_00570, partial [Sphingomicrobium sp.]
FGHGADRMSESEAARIAAILPLPKQRGAVSPTGFTRRYGNSIAARVGVVGRDGLDACVYSGTKAPVNKAPPKVSKPPRELPGEEYETATPPPPILDIDAPPVDLEPTPAPGTPDAPVTGSPTVVDQPATDPAATSESTELSNTVNPQEPR